MNDLQGETESRGHAPEDERRPARRGRCGHGRPGHRHPVAGGGWSLLGVGGVSSYRGLQRRNPTAREQERVSQGVNQRLWIPPSPLLLLGNLNYVSQI